MTHPLPPGSTIGILGGGQLGRMLAMAASRLGLSCHVYCPDPDSPAFDVCGAHTVAAYDDGTLNAKDKNVVVIGGGDTAIDCVRPASRQGAKSVQCLYRRARSNMPGSQREVANAEEEGVEFVWLTNPEAFVGDDKVTGVRAVKMRLGAPDAGGRQSPELIEGSNYTMDADMVILALGFEPEDLPTLFDAPELGVSRWGTVKIDFRSMMTNLDGVFAAGDIARGASLVVWAIRDGRDAADRIDEYLLARKEAAA